MPIRKKKIGIPRGISEDTFRIAKSDNKIKLFGKFNNRWYAAPLEDAFEVTNSYEASENSLITYNRKNKGRLVPNITATHDGVLTIRKKGIGKAATTDIQLYNNDGVLNFRNSDNTADVNLKAKKFTFDSTQSVEPSTAGEITYKSSTQALYAAARRIYLQGTLGSVEGDDCNIIMGNYNADAIIKTLDVSLYKWWFGYDKTSNEYTDATCVTTDGDATVTFTNGGNLDTLGIKGSPVTGAGIQAGTCISSFDASGNTLELTKTAIATANPVTLTFERVDERFKIHQNILGGTTAFADTSVFNLRKTGVLELFGTGASLKLSYDATNYSTLTTSASGATTFKTNDSDGTAGHLTLEVDGDIILDAAGGDIRANAPVEITSTTADQFKVLYDGSNYGLINVASDGHVEIESVGTDADMTLNAAGSITLNADDGAIRLGDGLGSFTPAHAADVTTKAYVDGLNKFYVHEHNYSGRMGTVNEWYVSNQSLGTSIVTADFGYLEYKYAMFNAVSACTFTGWSFRGYVSSTEPYELAIYQVTPPADGGTDASASAIIGTATDFASGDVTANRMYTADVTGLSVSVAAGQQIYLVHRYTHGSGNKTIYGSLTLEFEVA